MLRTVVLSGLVALTVSACGADVAQEQDEETTAEVSSEARCARNACGGCKNLPANPGASCGTCGSYVCKGRNTVVCSDPGTNACGGCSALANAPGAACGTCGTGTYVCSADTSSTFCRDPGTNACGGCSALTTAPGTPCGSNGASYVCTASKESVVCPY